MTNPIKALLARLVPQVTRIFYRDRHEQPAIAHMLDVDRLHGALRAAESGDTTDLWTIYRDCVASDAHVQGELFKRKLALLGDEEQISPWDEKSQEDAAAVAAIEHLMRQPACGYRIWAHLLDSVLYPVALVEKIYAPARPPARKTDPVLRYDLAELVPVPHHLQDFRDGELMVKDTDPETGAVLGTCHPADPSRYIIHRNHLLSTPDHWGGPMRAILFWWLFAVMDRAWWVRFLDRYGAPFIVGKYDQADDASRSVLTTAFGAASKLFGLVVSRETEIELVSSQSAQHGDAFEQFHQYAYDQISKFILGQTGTTRAQAQGIGSGQANVHEGVRQDLRAFDAMALGETLDRGLFRQFLNINSIPGNVIISWGAESIEDSQATAGILSTLSNSGLEPSDEALPVLSRRVGFQLTRKEPAPNPFGEPPAPFGKKPTKGSDDEDNDEDNDEDEDTDEEPPGKRKEMSAAKPSRNPGGPRANRSQQARDASDQIAAKAAPDLTRAFTGTLAPIRRIIAESQSPADLEAKIRQFYADYSPDRQAQIIEDALAANALNSTAT